MAKLSNLLPTVQVTISTTPQVGVYLDQLLTTGFYGKNRAEAAERLIVSTLKQLLKEGELSHATRKGTRGRD
jgi:hypothetical protein